MNQLNSDLKQIIVEYFDQLQTKLNHIGYTDVKVHLPDDITKALKYIIGVLNSMIELYDAMTYQYDLLEQSLQKSESECRNHIHIEQRLKIHCDNLQEVLTEQEKKQDEFKLKCENYEKHIQQLKKEIDLATRRRIEIEKSVTDSMDNRSRAPQLSCKSFLIVNGQTQKKTSMPIKQRLATETIETSQNKVRSISTLEHIAQSIHMRKQEDARQKRSSTLHIQILKKK